MSYIVTKLISSGEAREFYLIGSFSDLKRAAEVALEEYKAYNTKASFINLEMVGEWLATRGEYSFRRDAKNRLQLDISQVLKDELIPVDRQCIYKDDRQQDEVFVKLNKALVPDGISVAEKNT